MAEEPDALVGVLRGLELGDEEAEEAAVVWVGGVDEVVGVLDIPEIGVHGDDLQLRVLGMVDAVGCVVGLDVCCCLVVDSVEFPPDGPKMCVILLLQITICAWKRERGVETLGASVVVAYYSVDWAVR